MNDLAEKQSQYLKDRIDSVDKTTTVFERTFKEQERQIERLNNEILAQGVTTDLREAIPKIRRSYEQLRYQQPPFSPIAPDKLIDFVKSNEPDIPKEETSMLVKNFLDI